MGKNGSAKDEGKGTGAAKGRLNGGSQAVTILLFGLLPAAAVFTIAYLAFVNAQRTYLTNRNYRVLATASDQISGRFEGIEKALRSRLAVGDEATPFLTFDSSSEHVRQTWQSSKSAEAGKEAALDRVRASVSDAGGRAMMQFRYYADANDEEGKPLATSDLLKLVSSILLRDEFDDVLLIRPPNDVLYQRRTAETGAVPDLAGLLARADLAGGERSNFDALLGAIGKGTGKKETTSKEEAKPGGDPRAARARLFSEPIHTRYLGDRYLLFFRPVQFPPAIRSMLMKTSASPGKRPGAEVGKQEEPEWWLCGLVHEARFSNETRRIPTTWLVAALFLLAMALLAWPLLKVWYIGPRERFRAFDVALLAVSALIGSALMTFALLDFVRLRRPRGRVRRRAGAARPPDRAQLRQRATARLRSIGGRTVRRGHRVRTGGGGAVLPGSHERQGEAVGLPSRVSLLRSADGHRRDGKAEVRLEGETTVPPRRAVGDRRRRQAPDAPSARRPTLLRGGAVGRHVAIRIRGGGGARRERRGSRAGCGRARRQER